VERRYVLALLRDGILVRRRAVFNHRHFFLRSPKPRLIFDGRRLNARSAAPPWFRATDHRTFAALCSRYRYAAKFDFAHFYFNLRLHPELWQYFGFRCDLGEFSWTRCPFGWSWSASYAHDLAEAAVAYLSSLGIIAFHYMDDVVIFGCSEPSAAHRSRPG